MDNRTFDLDMEIAEKFFGWTRNERDWWVDGDGRFQCFVTEFHPSVIPRFNAMILDEIERRTLQWKWESYVDHERDIHTYCFEIQKVDDDPIRVWSNKRYYGVCIAALQVTGSI